MEYKNLKGAVQNLVDEEDKIQLRYIQHNYNVKGMQPYSVYLSEAGLYSLIISSRLRSAKEFKNWITRDILPSIRKFGYYQSKKNCKSRKKATTDPTLLSLFRSLQSTQHNILCHFIQTTLNAFSGRMQNSIFNQITLYMRISQLRLLMDNTLKFFDIISQK